MSKWSKLVAFLREHGFLTVLSLIVTWGATKGVIVGMAMFPDWPWADLIIPCLISLGIIKNWQPTANLIQNIGRKKTPNKQ